MFGRPTEVLPETKILVGELDYTAPGCYRNVEPLPFNVKPNQFITVRCTSDNPVDVVVANHDGSTATFKTNQTDLTLGPVPTENNKDMAVILGVFPGDKSNVTISVTMSKKKE